LSIFAMAANRLAAVGEKFFIPCITNIIKLKTEKCTENEEDSEIEK